MVDSDIKLTDKQQRFCEEYLVDLNATQAAVRAGYSEKTAGAIGFENLRKPEIQAYLQKLKEEQSERTQITADSVLSRLNQVADRCMQSEPVMVREGNKMVPSGEYKFDSSGANKALELLGKHLVLFTDKVDLTAKQQINVTLDE